jgi:hypothetical protein
LGLTAVTAYLEPGFTVEGGVAYWVTGGVVSSAQLGVGTPTTVFTDPLMYAFAVDSRAFYWTTGTTTGAVMELAR